MRMLLVGLALAATTSAVDARDFTITLSDTEVQYIGKVLGQQPYNDVNALLIKIQGQINTQLAPPAKEKPDEKRIEKW